MKNSLMRTLYHSFVCKWYNVKYFRGGWMLTSQYINDYKQRKGSVWRIARAHLKGWSYNDWCVCGINDENRKRHLSTEEYCSLHPLNDAYSFWIDDKLTLKYILHGTEAGQYMPDYYFQLDEGGSVLPLMDVAPEYANRGIEGIIDLLKFKGVLAFKLVKSSLGVGFYKVEYKDGAFYMNQVAMDAATFQQKLSSLRGYLVTEFLFPHPDIAKLCNQSVGCLRYLIGRRLDGELVDIYSFMRFGTKKSGFVENYNAGGVLAIIHDGKYEYGNVLDMERNVNRNIHNHPDTGVALQGSIPHWNEIVAAAHQVAKAMPQLCYMGIDFCVTSENKVKIIEINSLSSLDSLQTDQSILDTRGGAFFKERLNR